MNHPLSYSQLRIVRMIEFGQEIPAWLSHASKSNSSKGSCLGMMSHRALSNLHIIHQGQNGEYYRTKILAESCLEAMKRKSKNGSVLERSMTQKMSDTIFMQDGAPAHTTKLT